MTMMTASVLWAATLTMGVTQPVPPKVACQLCYGSRATSAGSLGCTPLYYVDAKDGLTLSSNGYTLTASVYEACAIDDSTPCLDSHGVTVGLSREGASTFARWVLPMVRHVLSLYDPVAQVAWSTPHAEVVCRGPGWYAEEQIAQKPEPKP